MLLIACNSNEKKATEEKESYEQSMKKLEERERKNPLLFLSIVTNDKHNLIGQTVIKGTISNHAKIVEYKDVLLELNFFSKTNVLLEKDKETIYELIAPGKSVDFKTKYFAPKGTDSIYIRILNAKPN